MKDRVAEFLPPDVRRIRWTKEQADRACGPIVYIFWAISGGNRRPLYIGRSGGGIERPLSAKHHRATSGRAVADEIEFICCKNKKESEALERKLIRNLQPELNVCGKRKPRPGVRRPKSERAKKTPVIDFPEVSITPSWS